MAATFEEPPRLPEEVLKTLLDRIPETSRQAQALIGPIAEQADKIRHFVDERGWIEAIDNRPSSDTIAAVDGAHAVDSTYAGDFVSAIAVAAEGLTPAGLVGSCRVHSAWSEFMVHDFDLDRLAKVAMIAQELALLTQLPHDIVVLDGSHQTPVVVLNSALASQSERVREYASQLCAEFEVVDNLQRLINSDRVVACPKADASRDLGEYIAKAWATEHGTSLSIPAADKVLAALVLEPGQMFKAFPVSKEWKRLHIAARADSGDVAANQLAHDLDSTIDPLRNQEVRIAYVKPHTCSTAIKVEFKSRLGADFRVY